MPGTKLEFSGGEDAMNLITSMCTTQGLLFDPSNPSGPLLRQPLQYPDPPITSAPEVTTVLYVMLSHTVRVNGRQRLLHYCSTAILPRQL